LVLLELFGKTLNQIGRSGSKYCKLFFPKYVLEFHFTSKILRNPSIFLQADTITALYPPPLPVRTLHPLTLFQANQVQELQEALEALAKENLRYAREEAARAAASRPANGRQAESRPHEKNLLLAALLAAPPGPLSLTALTAAVKEAEAAGPSSAAERDLEAAFNTMGRKHLSEEQVGCMLQLVVEGISLLCIFI